MPLHIVGISDNRVWTTTRISEAQGFAPWVDVGAAADAAADAAGAPHELPNNASLVGVGCAVTDTGASGTLQICVSWRTAGAAGLVHTIRTGPTSFFQWGNARKVAFPQLRSLDTGVACAAMGGQLYVCVAGLSAGLWPCVWRSIRNPSGAWSPVRAVSGAHPVITGVACAAVANGSLVTEDLHVVLRVQSNTGVQLFHNIARSDGSEQGDADMIPVNGLSADTTQMAAAGHTGVLSVLASNNVEMTLARRMADGSWAALEDARSRVQPGYVEPLTYPACAQVGGDLHIVATSQGRLMHAIRKFSGAYRNPESSPSSLFGDITCVAPPGPRGRAPAKFDFVSCAGHPAF